MSRALESFVQKVSVSPARSHQKFWKMPWWSGKVPVAIVAERRRLREIELRLYYATGTPMTRKPRSPLLHTAEATRLERARARA